MAMRYLMFAAVASAFELPAAATRRSVLTRVAAAVPLAAAVPAAFADANNEFLGYGKGTAPTGVTDSFSGKGVRMNRGDSKLIDDAGSVAGPNALYTPAQISASAPPRAVAGVRIGGKYSDPAHPGCTRTVTLIGTNKVLIKGADEDGKPWTVRGSYEGKTVTIDFTPKGGPKDVTAQYSIAGGLTFPDGNTWKKI